MDVVKKLLDGHRLTKGEYTELLGLFGDAQTGARLKTEAVRIRRIYYGNTVFIRGLIEFTNYCRNNCYYCGIRRGNHCVSRYRLNCEEILRNIRHFWPDCAVTLSVGEKSRESFRRFREAGAERYLLRHETADEDHYRKLHPQNMSLTFRKQCLYDLKSLGYQTGAGFMVGSPGQTAETLAEDLLFLQKLKPHMVGIGPFLPHRATKFAEEPAGSAELTLFLLAVIRIMLPKVLLPATTALLTRDIQAKERAMEAGANVLMLNLSPLSRRKDYELYDQKRYTGTEAAEGLTQLTAEMKFAGWNVISERGDCVW